MLTSHNNTHIHECLLAIITHIHECLLAIITHIYMNVNFPDYKYNHNNTHIHEC
jgi:hypothetical protein